MRSDLIAPADLEAILALHLATVYYPGLGLRLLGMFRRAEEVLRQPPGALRGLPGMPPSAAQRILDRASRELARRELRRAKARGTAIVAVGDPRYPQALVPLPDMPLVLYAAGSLDVLGASGAARPSREPGRRDEKGSRSPVAGIVGTRRPTPYASGQARILAGGLVRRGFVIVSGLAAGVDGEAHRAALEAGGRTVAVLGSGLDAVYPRQHRGLARDIVVSGRGAILTEYPHDAPPQSFHFPLRNRVLSGLCDAVVVVEAPERSGSLITARFALEQGKAIYVVPGRVSAAAIGGLRMLAEGATPALEPDDVLPGEGHPRGDSAGGSCARRSRVSLDGPLASGLLQLFQEEDSWHADRVAARLGRPPGEVLAELTRLELTGLLERLPGGAYALGVGG